MSPVLRAPIERIVVLRALMLGDLLCAVPALRALRRAFPSARIALAGLPWAREFAGRLEAVDDFIEFPGWPGLPETAPRVAAIPEFLAEVQAQRFDLALQLHGSGAIVNPLVACLGARQTGGFRTERAWYPADEAERWAPWPEQGHEIERLLALIDYLELPRAGTELEFPLERGDFAALLDVWPGLQRARPYVCIHAGAQLASRRWPASRFAAVADALARDGRTVVLTGSAEEAPLAAEIAARMQAPAVDLVGRTTLWTLGALIGGAEFVVCNDTGISHVAAALGCPSVVVSCGADVSRWAPLDRDKHRVLWQPMVCRPCAHAICPYDHGCATAIDVPSVLEAARRLSRRTAEAAAHA